MGPSYNSSAQEKKEQQDKNSNPFELIEAKGENAKKIDQLRSSSDTNPANKRNYLLTQESD